MLDDVTSGLPQLHRDKWGEVRAQHANMLGVIEVCTRCWGSRWKQVLARLQKIAKWSDVDMLLFYVSEPIRIISDSIYHFLNSF